MKYQVVFRFASGVTATSDVREGNPDKYLDSLFQKAYYATRILETLDDKTQIVNMGLIETVYTIPYGAPDDNN